MFNKLKTSVATGLESAPGGLKDKYELNRGPKGKWAPSRPGEHVAATAEELTAHSSVLQQQARNNIIPPPPRRGVPNPTSTPSTPSPPPPSTLRPQAPSAPIGRAPPPPIEIRATPAPPYAHAAVHDLPAAAARGAFGNKRFSEYGEDDKQELFGMLDDFFAMRLTVPTSGQAARQPVALARPPPVTTITRPASSSVSSPPRVNPNQPSYPPQEAYSSSALSILHFILDSPPSSKWYLSDNPMPPPLQGRNDLRWSGSWSQRGDDKSLIGFSLFGDASVAWWQFQWSARAEQSGRLDDSQVTKQGLYRPIPLSGEWDGDRLYAASERYGDIIVNFAVKAVASRRPVSHGECWDVAAEALNEVERQRPDLPKPFPSIGRTHGFCMFSARAGGSGEGIWKGGDGYVRPGDIVEWRKVTIRELGGSKGSYSMLGDPDHTAVIIQAGDPTSIPSEGEPYPISALNSITVVEQSQGQLPQERTYDLAEMSAGEIWIYRPVGLVDFTGTEVEAKWPPNCKTWKVGELK